METTILQSKQCILCHQNAAPSMGKQKGYWYCQTCSLGWIKRIPKITYQSEYYTSGSSLLGKLYVPVEKFFYMIRNSYANSLIKSLWIDVGAGDGNYLIHVPSQKKIGVEVSSSSRETMKRNGLQVLTNNEFLKTSNLKADVISFWQVLEHVQKPLLYVTAAEKNLKKTGIIIIAVPNVASHEFALFGKYWFHLAPLYHIWHFSPRSLSILLEKANLQVERIDYWAVEHHLTGSLQTIINRTTKSEDILHKLIKRRQNLQKLTAGQKLWILFWCSMGLPLVILFWIFSSLSKRPGTFVITASKKRT
jgi:hypothetical protein